MPVRLLPYEEDFPNRLTKGTSCHSSSAGKNQTNNKIAHSQKTKTTIPDLPEYFVKRNHLNCLIEEMLEKFRNVLILGRSGTGKTSLATDFCKTYQAKTLWINLTFSDRRLSNFLNHFSDENDKLKKKIKSVRKLDNLTKLFEDCFLLLAEETRRDQNLIVLDNLHKIYEADWFQDFFKSIVHSMSDNLQFMMLSRSNPPLPTWRFRSKQMLGVIEESTLLFTKEEAAEFLIARGFDMKIGLQLYEQSNGKIGRFSKLIESRLGNP
jgi:ATP/maltotriose-dependent transcriptional regulator MalT